MPITPSRAHSGGVPTGQLGWIAGPMTQKDTKVVHPCRRKKHVVVAPLTLRDLSGQGVKPRLMSKLVPRLRLSANIASHGIAPVNLCHAAPSNNCWA